MRLFLSLLRFKERRPRVLILCFVPQQLIIIIIIPLLQFPKNSSSYKSSGFLLPILQSSPAEETRSLVSYSHLPHAPLVLPPPPAPNSLYLYSTPNCSRSIISSSSHCEDEPKGKGQIGAREKKKSLVFVFLSLHNPPYHRLATKFKQQRGGRRIIFSFSYKTHMLFSSLALESLGGSLSVHHRCLPHN